MLSKFIDVYENPYQTAKSWKAATKKKVIGCLPMYAPEEIIHAAGILPVIMFEDEEPVTLGDKYLQTNACEMMRSTYNMILMGKFDFLDGVVIQEICDQPRFFGEVLESSEVFPYIEHLWPVYRLDKTTRPFIIEELSRFRSTL